MYFRSGMDKESLIDHQKKGVQVFMIRTPFHLAIVFG
jgi:hypothetical protein